MESSIKNSYEPKVSIDNLTVLWAFSEAALGGMLHALKIPFTGLFIGSIAVIIISLIAKYSENPKIIFSVTLKVILVKFFVSPHSPINAYLAVIIQSLLGYVLFFKGFNNISPILLGFLTQLFSSFQKLIVLTVIFGMTLWESIDLFFNYILKSLNIITAEHSSSFSQAIIYTYIISHLVGGILAGIYAIRLPGRLKSLTLPKIEFEDADAIITTGEKRKRPWWLKPNSIFVFIMSVSLIIVSYINNDFEDDITIKILIMLGRSVLILFVWFYYISPLLLKLLSKKLSIKQQAHLDEVKSIINVFPKMRKIISYSWSNTAGSFIFYRPLKFIDNVIINFLVHNQNE